MISIFSLLKFFCIDVLNILFYEPLSLSKGRQHPKENWRDKRERGRQNLNQIWKFSKEMFL